MQETPVSLCFRCDYRAQFLETGRQPRCECGNVNSAVCGCYMYKPVQPVILKKNKGDTRSQLACAMLSARSHGSRIPELQLDIKKYKDGLLFFWIPKERKKDDNSK